MMKKKRKVKREKRLVGVEVLRAGDELVAVVEHRHARRHEAPPDRHRLDVTCRAFIVTSSSVDKSGGKEEEEKERYRSWSG
jgi:hypothetical protein